MESLNLSGQKVLSGLERDQDFEIPFAELVNKLEKLEPAVTRGSGLGAGERFRR